MAYMGSAPLSGNSLNKNTGTIENIGMWLEDWIRNYYVDRGKKGEELENAVGEALSSIRTPSINPVIFRVRVTDDTFRISPYNTRYVTPISLVDVAKEVDDTARQSLRKIQIHPILVRPGEKPGTWYIIAGVRRAAALLNSYADIRIYIPRNPKEEALISAYENIVRDEVDDLTLLLIADKAADLGVEEEMLQLLDERTRQRIGTLRRPKRLERREIQEPIREPANLENQRKNNNIPERLEQRQPVHALVESRHPSHSVHVHDAGDVEKCPNCGAVLQPVCGRCGAPV
jgi:hypothetical protein